MTTTAPEPTDTTRVEWIEVGSRTRRLPASAREKFLPVAEAVHWRQPNGSMPFSPGSSLQSVIREFDVRGITAVSYSGMWQAHDTTGTPGYFGDYTCTNTVLGIRVRVRDRETRQVVHQRMFFLDGGCQITPVLIITDPPTPEGMTKCDVCGDVSNSAPDLPCGRVDEPEDTDSHRYPPCSGTYRTYA